MFPPPPPPPPRTHLKLAAEVPELLVADGFDGAGVHRAAGMCLGQGKGILRHHRLPRTGVGRNKHLQEVCVGGGGKPSYECSEV
jgi:hypothetical protein